MPFTENEVYEAFGLEKPTTGAQAQEVADPEGQASADQTAGSETAAQGAQGQSIAETGTDDPVTANSDTDPADSETDAGDADDEADTAADDAGKAANTPLTPEQRRANAARRREAEKQAAVDAAVTAAVKAEQDRQKEQMEVFFKQTGMKNTFTNEPIRSMEDFNAWQRQFAEQKIQQDLKAGNLTPEALQAAVSQHPVFKEAERIVSTAKQQQEAQQAAADKARIDAEFTEIAKFDPEIQSVSDLVKVPEFPQINEMVKRGYRITDAVKLARSAVYNKRAVEAARQQAVSNARSKEHLTATGNARGAGAVSVPSDVMASFRLFNPNATEEQIQQFYNGYLKKKG